MGFAISDLDGETQLVGASGELDLATAPDRGARLYPRSITGGSSSCRSHAGQLPRLDSAQCPCCRTPTRRDGRRRDHTHRDRAEHPSDPQDHRPRLGSEHGRAGRRLRARNNSPRLRSLRDSDRRAAALGPGPRPMRTWTRSTCRPSATTTPSSSRCWSRPPAQSRSDRRSCSSGSGMCSCRRSWSPTVTLIPPECSRVLVQGARPAGRRHRHVLDRSLKVRFRGTFDGAGDAVEQVRWHADGSGDVSGEITFTKETVAGGLLACARLWRSDAAEAPRERLRRPLAQVGGSQSDGRPGTSVILCTLGVLERTPDLRHADFGVNPVDKPYSGRWPRGQPR